MSERKDECLDSILGEDLIHHKFRPFALDSVTFIFFDKFFMHR